MNSIRVTAFCFMGPACSLVGEINSLLLFNSIMKVNKGYPL